MKRTTTVICTLILTAGSLFAQGISPQKGSGFLPERKAPGTALRAGEREWTTLRTTNYTATDIKGNKYDLGALLKSGKKVLIDFSTVWCGYCWELHNSKILDKLAAKYGPSGTNELVVLWVEGEGASAEQIRDPKQDWTNGGTWPIPIISDAKMAPTLGVAIIGWPTIALISPEGAYTEILQEVSDGIDAVYGVMKECMDGKSKPKISVVGIPPNGTMEGKSVTFPVKVRTVAPVTGYKWTFEGGTPATSSEETPSVTWAKAGTYKIALTVTNANGDSEPYTGAIKVGVYKEVNKFPWTDSFESGIDCSWTLIDADRDGHNWMTISSLLGPLGMSKENIAKYARTGADCASSWSFLPNGLPEKYGWPGISLLPDNYLITPAITFPVDALKPEASFYVRSMSEDPSTFDRYKVLVSATGTEKADFTDEVKPSGVAPGEIDKAKNPIWNHVVLDLSKYKGKKIYIAFVHLSNNTFGLLLDDVAVGIDGTLSNERVARAEAGLQIAVNAVDRSIDVAGEGLRAVRVFDVTGRAIAVAKAVGGSIVLNTSGYGQGVYILRADTAAGEVVRKVIVR